MGFCSDIFLVILSLFLPPLPVIIRRGLCSADVIINIALCCLGLLPGLVHSWYIIAKYPGDYDSRFIVEDEENTIYYVPIVQPSPTHQISPKKNKKKKKPQRVIDYSSINSSTITNANLNDTANSAPATSVPSTSNNVGSTQEFIDEAPPPYSEFSISNSTDNKQSSI